MSSSYLPITTDAIALSEERAPQVSVVVPVYNEVESLPKLINAISSTLRDCVISYELLCVDDGSTDGSTELLHAWAR
ncbi:MAG: glycosyltransferase, partial [Cyanobacteria bacterium P01_D01_bin.123]